MKPRKRIKEIKKYYKKFGSICFYCNTHLMDLSDPEITNHYGYEIPPKNYPTLDHLIPRSLGGTIIVVACDECNNKKADSLPTERDIKRFMEFNSGNSKLLQQLSDKVGGYEEQRHTPLSV